MTFLPAILIALGVLSGGFAPLRDWSRGPRLHSESGLGTLEGIKLTLPSNLTEIAFISVPGMYQPPILGRRLPLSLDLLVYGLQIIVLI